MGWQWEATGVPNGGERSAEKRRRGAEGAPRSARGAPRDVDGVESQKVFIFFGIVVLINLSCSFREEKQKRVRKLGMIF